MNKDNDNCDIVKDLSVPYIENFISSKSKIFVDNHLSNCTDCKKYYETLTSDIFKTTKIELENDKIEINHLKKFNKHITILKSILLIILLLIIISIIMVFSKYYKANYILESAYNKIETMRESNNYIFVQNTIYKNIQNNDTDLYESIYYYKDGKYKIDHGNNVLYFKDNSFESISIYHDLKQIEKFKSNSIIAIKGDTFDIFTDIELYKKIYPGFNKINMNIREEKYNGTECYVIRFGDGKESYKDTWINKESLMIVKVVDEEYGNHYREVTYSFNENVTTDDDVDDSVLNTERYNDYVVMNLTETTSTEIKD